MRNTLIIATIISAVFLSSCDDKIEITEDNIVHSEINKTITVTNIDSISGGCRHLVFEIDTSNEDNKQVMVYRNVDFSYDCDGYNELIVLNDDLLKILNKDANISESNLWSGEVAYLDDFAGNGEKFIGYRAVASHSGPNQELYYYGWIKVELSADKSQLKIISRADNLTEGSSIKAGQVE